MNIDKPSEPALWRLQRLRFHVQSDEMLSRTQMVAICEAAEDRIKQVETALAKIKFTAIVADEDYDMAWVALEQITAIAEKVLGDGYDD